MIHAGSGEPLVLLHGILGGERMWHQVVPLLAGDFEVFAPTALGHHGGRMPAQRPAEHADVVDEAERQLDELGLDKPHLAGNSMGGWMALELAARGRARTVCALSPAGCWELGSPELHESREKLRFAAATSPEISPKIPELAQDPAFRAAATSQMAVDGARMTPEQVTWMFEDLFGCEIAPDLLSREDRNLGVIDPLPCPVTIAWAAEDRVFPPAHHVPLAERRVPAARHFTLENVGHVPMWDDPELVAETIRKATQR